MAKCQNCGKGTMRGNRVSHAKNRTKRIYKPNLHKATVVVGGVRKKLTLCTKCIRKLKKESSKSQAPNSK